MYFIKLFFHQSFAFQRESSFILFQIDLFWRRTVTDATGSLFCLVDVGLLDYDVSEKAEHSMEKHLHGKKGSQIHICLLSSVS